MTWDWVDFKKVPNKVLSEIKRQNCNNNNRSNNFSDKPKTCLVQNECTVRTFKLQICKNYFNGYYFYNISQFWKRFISYIHTFFTATLWDERRVRPSEKAAKENLKCKQSHNQPSYWRLAWFVFLSNKL